MSGAVRAARYTDIGRIAEILVFSKRAAYRDIFHDDYGSFVLLNVADIIKEYQNAPAKLSDVLVYEENGIVKGVCRALEDVAGVLELCELYVEPCFQGGGIGSALLSSLLSSKTQYERVRLWVLEENAPARLFYERRGFIFDGETRLCEGTNATELLYIKMMC